METKYSLNITKHLYESLKQEADKHHVTVEYLIRKFIMLGMTISALDADPDSKLILKKQDQEREISLWSE